MDIINDAAVKQTPVGSSKRRLPSSCAADYRGASSVEKDINRKRRRTAPLTRTPPVAQKDTKSAVSELAQYKQIAEYHQPEIQKPTAGLSFIQVPLPQYSEFPSLYNSPTTYTAPTPSPISPTPLPSSATATDLLVGGVHNPPAVAFIQEQTSVSSQVTVNHGTDVVLRNPLPPEVSRVEEQIQSLESHLNPIPPATSAWVSIADPLLPTVYSSGVFSTLQGSTSNSTPSRNVTFPTPDVYQLQESSQRPISHQPLETLRYPCYAWPDAWLTHQPVPVSGQQHNGSQPNMAITQSSLRVAVPAAHRPLEIHLKNSNTFEQDAPGEQSDADYVIVNAADSTSSGSRNDVTQPGEVEEVADVANLDSSRTSTALNTPPRLSSSWDIVAPVRDLDEENFSNDESYETCHGQPISPNNKVVVSQEDDESSGGSSKAPKRRQTFNEIDRQETSRTRNVGACLRCKMQRIRCKENPSNPEGPCRTCTMVSKTSKKVIHHIQCVRWKLQEITLFRTSGLGLTKRWDGVTIRDVDFADYPQVDIRNIQMEQGLCSEPLSFRVRKFKPQDGDVLYRKWYDSDEKVYKLVYLEPFALADIHETKDMFVKYIDQHALECLHSFVSNTNNDVLGVAEDVVRDTYAMAWNHLQSLGDDEQHADERSLLVNLFRFWFALRHTTGSSWITGEERLDMAPVGDPSYPAALQGKISTPRMIIAQFDSINTQYVLRNLSKRILEKLERFMKTKNTNRYLTIFVSCFILLHEISHMTNDRYRHGRANGVEGGYSLPLFVRDLQESANIILVHWHYYNSGLNPLAMDWDQRHKTPLADLSENEIMYLITTWQRIKDREEQIRSMWQLSMHFISLYFIAQMFEPKWSPRKTFMG